MLNGKVPCFVWLWIERSLFIGGLACLTWFGTVWLQATLYQRSGHAIVSPTFSVKRPIITEAPVAGSFIGTLEVPRLGLKTIIAEGEEDSTLRVAVGHLSDTPLPWETGNSALAAHRDTLFRPLRGIRVGDELRLRTMHGSLRYRVRETIVVDPDDVWVVGPTTAPTLTMITCYPFQYVGHAPRRFVVRAERIADVN